jgi:hypothetical protein
MKKISSGNLFITKKVFPVLWFGILGVVLFSMVFSGAYQRAFPMLIFPVFMALVGFFLMKKLVWDLMDEVYDCGDFLLVKNGSEEDQVPLSNIMNVSISLLTNPQRITLRLVTPGKFGEEIAFAPQRQFTLNPFAKNPIAEDLMVRVDQARAGRRL